MSRNYVFTLNNPLGDLDLSSLTHVVKGAVWQKEKGESGTVHYQGYVRFKKQMSLLQLKALQPLLGAHWEPRKGTHSQALEYCIKESTRVSGPWYFGDIVLSSGKRNDLDSFLDAVKDGMTETDSFDLFPSVHAKFPRFISQAFERKRMASITNTPFVPRPGWQSDLYQQLQLQPDARTITWVYDSVGNLGKSIFANNYTNAYVITGGKHADVFYAYKFEPVVFFDWPRDAQDRFPYSVAESFKNGYFLSTKYECRRVRFNIPHVVVFSNSLPEMDKLSLDRWDIKYID
nr:MAG: replication associated protein [Cressdnaviricota sp.]